MAKRWAGDKGLTVYICPISSVFDIKVLEMDQTVMNIFNTLSILVGLFFALSAKAQLNADGFPLRHPVIDTPSHRVTTSSTFNITLGIRGFSNDVTFVLEPNHDLVAKDTHVHHLDVQGRVKYMVPLTDSYRIFKGSVWMPTRFQTLKQVGWARITVIRDGLDPLFEGAFAIESEQYLIQVENDAVGQWKRGKERMIAYQTSGAGLKRRVDDERLSLYPACKSEQQKSVESLLTLQNRQFPLGEDDLTDSIGSTSGCPSTRRMAYIGIATDCSYTASFESADAVRRNILNVVNTASVVFENSFNITLGLRNLTISDAACPTASDSTGWNAPCSTGNLDWRLQRFSSWRGSLDDDNAYWTLMTSCNTGGEVGISWIGALCNSGVDSFWGDSSAVGASVVARTDDTEWQVFAHESAHTFGAVHDCGSTTCATESDTTSQCCPMSSSTCDAQGEYIMNPTVGIGMTRFSPCTIGNVCSRLGRSINTRCLVGYSDEGAMNNPGTCGNGIVEAGEACDCGEDSCDEHDAQCCDATTCQWRDCDRSGSSDPSDGESSNDLTTWLDRHRSLVIGLSAGIGGGLVLVVVMSCLLYSCKGRKAPPEEISKEGRS